MRINHNIQALNAYRNLATNQGNVAKSLEKLSSGLRINRAADDAAGLAISEKMRSQIRGLGQGERNSLDMISLIQTAEGALNTVHSIVQRMRELAVQASNGTLSDEDRGAIQNEINQLTEEIDKIGENTQFNKKQLLAGGVDAAGNPTALQVIGQTGANEGESIEVTIAKTDATTLGIRDDAGAIISVSNQADAEAAITVFEAAINTISTERSKLGAFQNRLEYKIDYLKVARENLTASESRIRDVDMALEMTEFTKNNILNQSAQAMLAQANQLPQGVLQLLN